MRPRYLFVLLALTAVVGLAGCGEDAQKEDSVPTTGTDSGGGAEQFRQPGGDNSVLETGEEADEGEFAEAAAALHGFLDARSRRVWAAACDYLAAGLVASMQETAAQPREGPDSCAAGLEAFTNPAGLAELRSEAKRADVGSVRVAGESGFVIYGVGKAAYAIAIAWEDGEWKMAGLGGFPLL